MDNNVSIVIMHLLIFGAVINEKLVLVVTSMLAM